MKTVLIVDPDHAINGIGSMVSTQGFLSLVMSDADTALGIMRSDLPVDLIITEVLLPDMEGMEFLRMIRTAAPRIPVLVLTREQSIECYLRAMSEGIVDYLYKPARIAELKRCAFHALTPAEHDPTTAREV